MAKEYRPQIPDKVKIRLWTSSGGRCQFDNCNKVLWRNELTMAQMNISYIAHIYAFSPLGPRYDDILSPKLEKDLSNLMLVCDACHRTFDDKAQVDLYPARRLLEMKRDHENRIELLTSIQPDKKSHIVLFGAKIGEHNAPLQFNKSIQAILHDYYPANHNPIELGLKNSSFKDSDDMYWQFESENLKNIFNEKLGSIKSNHQVQHFSVFALAPQPLLILFGTLLNDFYPADIYQLHREPSTWNWLDHKDEIELIVDEPKELGKIVALKIALSASISEERISSVLGDNISIWSVTIPTPSNDFLQSKKQLKAIRECFRSLFDRIKNKHGQNAELNIFPAMPVSAAIELGRVWMPKADLPFTIYDQNRTMGGFYKTLKIE